MSVYTLDPVEDSRWTEFVRCHPHSSIFHTAGWLRALRDTFGYQPIAFTTASPGAALTNGIVLCAVPSWITGLRLVSLPFSDHCEPLADPGPELTALCAALQSQLPSHRWRYIELRPRRTAPCPPLPFRPSAEFCLHLLDLRPGLDALFGACHKDSVQRKIRRAEREGLEYEDGRTRNLLQRFFRLLLLTRRRHGVPPQPFKWFVSLASCLGESLTVRLVSKQGEPIAAMLTLRHGDTVVYKYGASNAAFHRLGGMHALFWKTIQDGRHSGCATFDLGRTDLDNTGLLTFKDRWGAVRAPLTYWRYPMIRGSRSTIGAWCLRRAGGVLRHAPDWSVAAAGRLLYKHVG